MFLNTFYLLNWLRKRKQSTFKLGKSRVPERRHSLIDTNIHIILYQSISILECTRAKTELGYIPHEALSQTQKIKTQPRESAQEIDPTDTMLKSTTEYLHTLIIDLRMRWFNHILSSALLQLPVIGWQVWVTILAASPGGTPLTGSSHNPCCQPWW